MTGLLTSRNQASTTTKRGRKGSCKIKCRLGGVGVVVVVVTGVVDAADVVVGLVGVIVSATESGGVVESGLDAGGSGSHWLSGSCGLGGGHSCRVGSATAGSAAAGLAAGGSAAAGSAVAGSAAAGLAAAGSAVISSCCVVQTVLKQYFLPSRMATLGLPPPTTCLQPNAPDRCPPVLFKGLRRPIASFTPLDCTHL